MKVVHVTSAHPHGDVRIELKEARSLAEAGHDVVVMAPGPVRVPGVPGVGRVVLPQVHGRLGRFAIGAPRAMWRARRMRAQLYHLHDPELLPFRIVLPSGARVVYDAHEDLRNQVHAKGWIPVSLRRAISHGVARVMPALAGSADAVVAATPHIAATFAGATTVRNLPLLSEFDDGAERPYPGRAPVAAYVGSITAVRGGFEMVDAAAAVRSPGFSLELAGPVENDDLLRRLKRRDEAGKCSFLGWQAREGVASLLGRARLGLVVLHPLPNYVDALPVKLFEYMAAAIPFVASDFPPIRSIVETHGCGLLVDPLDPLAVAAAIDSLLDDEDAAEAMGQKGREAVLTALNWDQEVRALLGVYEALD
jgi:glycosyltransferase involved in cell wall biosynthesis